MTTKELMQLAEQTAASGSGLAGRVFGQPVEKDGVTLFPVVVVRGGGGGRGDRPVAGFMARAAGAYVIRNGTVRWMPAVDVNRIVLGGQIVAIVALVTTAIVVLRRRRSARRADAAP
jgi:hypothetical protein